MEFDDRFLEKLVKEQATAMHNRFCFPKHRPRQPPAYRLATLDATFADVHGLVALLAEEVLRLRSKSPFHPLPSPLANTHQHWANHPSGYMVEVDVEDWADRVIGGPIRLESYGNPAVDAYCRRRQRLNLPLDNDVVYVKDFIGLGHLVHLEELFDAQRRNLSNPDIPFPVGPGYYPRSDSGS